LLITLIGNWGLIALGLTVLLVILQVWIATRVSQLRSQNIADTDQRVHLMHEILQNIKLVKFYAWVCVLFLLHSVTPALAHRILFVAGGVIHGEGDWSAC
jgi:hypothetical protein